MCERATRDKLPTIPPLSQEEADDKLASDIANYTDCIEQITHAISSISKLYEDTIEEFSTLHTPYDLLKKITDSIKQNSNKQYLSKCMADGLLRNLTEYGFFPEIEDTIYYLNRSMSSADVRSLVYNTNEPEAETTTNEPMSEDSIIDNYTTTCVTPDRYKSKANKLKSNTDPSYMSSEHISHMANIIDLYNLDNYIRDPPRICIIKSAFNVEDVGVDGIISSVFKSVRHEISRFKSVDKDNIKRILSICFTKKKFTNEITNYLLSTSEIFKPEELYETDELRLIQMISDMLNVSIILYKIKKSYIINVRYFYNNDTHPYYSIRLVQYVEDLKYGFIHKTPSIATKKRTNSVNKLSEQLKNVDLEEDNTDVKCEPKLVNKRIEVVKKVNRTMSNSSNSSTGSNWGDDLIDVTNDPDNIIWAADFSCKHKLIIGVVPVDSKLKYRFSIIMCKDRNCTYNVSILCTDGRYCKKNNCNKKHAISENTYELFQYDKILKYNGYNVIQEISHCFRDRYCFD